MDDGIINVSYVGLEGLTDRIVMEVADSYRANIRRWKRNTLAGNEIKSKNAEEQAWEDLVWFISGYIEDMYIEEVDGGMFYERLLEEWIEMQNKINVYVDIPAYVLSMEEKYYEARENDK